MRKSITPPPFLIKTGLDAACAMSVMRYLRALASSSIEQLCADSGTAADSSVGGTAVVATIHQPRPSIWLKFDLVRVAAVQ